MPTKTLQIPTADGQADAFAAFPDRGERHPGVLIYTDAFGVRPVLREMARELAGHGYYVLVPNIYYRHGPAPVTELPEHIGEEIRPAVIAKLMPLIEAHTTEQILRDADAVYIDQIRKAQLYDQIWQAFAVLLPVKTVGVMGDARTYENVLALRAVTSSDGMTADVFEFPWSVLTRAATRIVNQVRGVNRVVYDVTSKPPGTIEWE